MRGNTVAEVVLPVATPTAVTVTLTGGGIQAVVREVVARHFQQFPGDFNNQVTPALYMIYLYLCMISYLDAQGRITETTGAAIPRLPDEAPVPIAIGKLLEYLGSYSEGGSEIVPSITITLSSLTAAGGGVGFGGTGMGAPGSIFAGVVMNTLNMVAGTGEVQTSAIAAGTVPSVAVCLTNINQLYELVSPRGRYLRLGDIPKRAPDASAYTQSDANALPVGTYKYHPDVAALFRSNTTATSQYFGQVTSPTPYSGLTNTCAVVPAASASAEYYARDWVTFIGLADRWKNGSVTRLRVCKAEFNTYVIKWWALDLSMFHEIVWRAFSQLYQATTLTATDMAAFFMGMEAALIRKLSRFVPLISLMGVLILSTPTADDMMLPIPVEQALRFLGPKVQDGQMKLPYPAVGATNILQTVAQNATISWSAANTVGGTIAIYTNLFPSAGFYVNGAAVTLNAAWWTTYSAVAATSRIWAPYLLLEWVVQRMSDLASRLQTVAQLVRMRPEWEIVPNIVASLDVLMVALASVDSVGAGTLPAANYQSTDVRLGRLGMNELYPDFGHALITGYEIYSDSAVSSFKYTARLVGTVAGPVASFTSLTTCNSGLLIQSAANNLAADKHAHPEDAFIDKLYTEMSETMAAGVHRFLKVAKGELQSAAARSAEWAVPLVVKFASKKAADVLNYAASQASFDTQNLTKTLAHALV